MTRESKGRHVLQLAALGGVALVVTSVLAWLGPDGTDVAAHVYQRAIFLQHGFVLWNNYWYAGRYSLINYSVLYYPLAAIAGNKALAVASFVVATVAFAVLAGREWGSASRLSTLSFAVIWSAFVITGAFPFDLGVALALLALVAAQAHRVVGCAVLTMLTAAASPLAFVLLAAILLGIGLSKRGSGVAWRWIAFVVAAVGAIEVGLVRLFPSGGNFPFPSAQLAGGLGLCGGIVWLTHGSERARPLRSIALVLALACVASYLVPSSVGANIIRFRFVALPLVLLAVSITRPRRRLVAAAVIVLAGCWNLVPLVAGFAQASRDASASAVYWRPAVRFLRGHLSPSYRVEAVDSGRHWAAAYLPAAGIPMVRGWFRQDDLPQNHLLYGRLTRRSYLTWLRGLGVRFVVLTDAAPDYSAKAEASLIRGGRSGLIPVFAMRRLTIFSVPSPKPIVTGPGRAQVLDMRAAELRVQLPRAGSYRLAVRYSPYWRSSAGCLAASPSGLMRLTVTRSAVARLTFSVSVDKALDVLAGEQPERCSQRTHHLVVTQR